MRGSQENYVILNIKYLPERLRKLIGRWAELLKINL